MIEVRKYKGGDAELREWRKEVTPHVDLHFLDSDSWSIFLDDEIIAIMGLQVMWPKVAQVTMLVSDDVEKCGKEFSLEVTKALVIHAAYYDLRKVYAIVDDANGRDKMWIERIGFVKEYVMAEAGPDSQDMIGYAYDPKVVGTDYMNTKEK